ncbi:OadG family protein [Brassicibacter mesophilus]|jgi:glutaconyl-CoA/methylmalonyl-CoA decarboxylase subunit delta|uniref:OadG family protein n=1 Tax=Brassicibacter mesophilus TaxID=745119 RepID=UPI003D26034E
MNLTDGVSINEALIITLFSMGLVFVTLLTISLILDGFRAVFHKKGPQKKEEKAQQPPVKKEAPIVETEEDEELIAVITAAIASSLSKTTSDIVVKNIQRVPQNTPAWAKVGRQEQFNIK